MIEGLKGDALGLWGLKGDAPLIKVRELFTSLSQPPPWVQERVELQIGLDNLRQQLRGMQARFKL